MPENETDYYSLSYESFVPLLVSTLHEQQTQIDQMKVMNDQLRHQVSQLQVLDVVIRALENKQ